MSEIDLLVSELASKDGMARHRACQSLVDIGSGAVSPLIELLADSRNQVRWEAAKALGQIADPAATEALVGALQDRVFDIRWLAAEGLIAIGCAALVPLLRVLVTHADALSLREGAHHVLHDLARQEEDLVEVLEPVLAALEGVEPSVEVPLAAESAIGVLTGRCLSG